jgi:hypothetical protein
MPALSSAVDESAADLAALDDQGLHPQVGDAVRTLDNVLNTAQGPLHGTASAFTVLPTLLGADGPKTYLVMLQQHAEARGTGGLMGSYALIRAENGKLTLLGAYSRGELPGGAAIPTSTMPTELQELWGPDLAEWAGLNLSPHFPWTGQLVDLGWKARKGAPALDYVAAVDGNTLAALLAGTGPVTVDGVTLSSANAADFLAREVYATFSDPKKVDAFTAALVAEVLRKATTGGIAVQPLVTALAEPVSERRLLLWAADPPAQARLERMAIGGVIPDDPGPFAMAVVNNGGGNKLDAYLDVATSYDPGTCEQDVRIGHITVTVTNNAPARGLPGYVIERNDLLDRGLRNPTPGSNRLIVSVYGPVGATSPLATLDGAAAEITTGQDRRHPVWRTEVSLAPGQTRTFDVIVLDPAAGATIGSSGLPAPAVWTQPLARPAKVTTKPLTACSADSEAGTNG